MPQPRLPFFRDLDFGLLDARDEAQASEGQFQRSYFDFKDAAYRIAAGDAWALVGPKGAGKSAALEYLRITWAPDPMKFLDRWELGDFPVADVTHMQVGAGAGPSSARAAWQFLLLLRVFASLMQDEGASYGREVTQLAKDLRSAGLIGGDDLRTRFGEWTSSTVRYAIAGFGGESTYAEHGATALQLVEVLRLALKRISTSSTHVISIDGLDSFFAQSDDAFDSLAALVDAVFELNLALSSSPLHVSLVVAIRSDMFAQLPSTDSAKMTNHAVELDWSNRGADEGNQLWQVVNRKAVASVLESFDGRRPTDLRRDYLASPIAIKRWNTLPAYLLEHTRLVPRDLIALMRAVRDHHSGPGPVHQSSAQDAVRSYSETYFIREVSNGLSRVLSGPSARKVAGFIDALSALPSKLFSADDLRRELGGLVDDQELRELLKQMFTIGGIGVRSGSGARKHTNFVFRRTAGGGFSYLAEYRLHNALVVAWNIRE